MSLYLEYMKDLQFSNKRKNHNLKIGKDLNKHFSKEIHKKTKQHTKLCSTPLVVRKMQIKTTLR